MDHHSIISSTRGGSFVSSFVLQPATQLRTQKPVSTSWAQLQQQCQQPIQKLTSSCLQYGFLPDTDTLTVALSSWSTHTQSSIIDSAQNGLATYEALLKEDPVTTKAITSGALAVIGDAIAQFSSSKSNNEEEFEYNVKRGVGFLVFGALYTGAFQHFWFNYLSDHIASWGNALRIWGTRNPDIKVDQMYGSAEWWMYFDVKAQLDQPPSDAALAVAKLAVNQFGMVPGLYMPLFFAMTGALADLNPRESIERAKSMYLPLLQRNYFYWLPVQFFQFFAVPTEWQIPFLSTASLFWTVILSSISSQQQTPTAQYVVYSEEEEPIVTKVVNKDVTDDVRLEDVEQNLVPGVVKSTLKNPKVRATTTGGLLGLLAAAAEDGFLAGLVARTLPASFFAATLNTSAEGSGVGFLAALGATIGLLATSRRQKEPKLVSDAEGAIETNVIDDCTMDHDVEGSASLRNGHARSPRNGRAGDNNASFLESSKPREKIHR